MDEMDKYKNGESLTDAEFLKRMVKFNIEHNLYKDYLTMDMLRIGLRNDKIHKVNKEGKIVKKKKYTKQK